jgi:hypothetical protein
MPSSKTTSSPSMAIFFRSSRFPNVPCISRRARCKAHRNWHRPTRPRSAPSSVIP